MTHTVTFPGLGLEFQLNRVAVQIFGLNIYWYGVIIGTGFLLAVLWCCKQSYRYGITQDNILDLLIPEVPLCIVGLRVYYVVFYLDRFRDANGKLDFWAMLNIRDGGLAIYGAVITAAIVLLVFCRVKKLSFLAFADLGVQGLLVGQIIGRWGNFMNVEAYGGVTDLPWRMCSQSIANELWQGGLLASQEQYQAILDGTLGVHPTFFYESAWNLIGLIALYLIARRGRKFDGELFLGYLFWYGLGRFWIEGLRTDSLYFFGLELFGQPIRTSQMVALLSAVVGGVLLVYLRFFRKGERPELFVEQKARLDGEKEKVKEEEKEES